MKKHFSPTEEIEHLFITLGEPSKDMDWLFDKRGKSVANSAKRVVADMHEELEKKRLKINELESLVAHLQMVATGSLENELFRLELKRKELIGELESTDAAIIDRRYRLEVAREEVRKILSNSSVEHNNGNSSLSVCSRPDAAHQEEQIQFIQTSLAAVPLSALELKAQKLENQYFEESQVYLSIRSDIPNTLFVVHRNTEDTTVVYVPGASTEIVSCFKYSQQQTIELGGEKNSRKSDLSSMEVFISFGAKVVPNHDRDYPHVRELAIPAWLFKDSNITGTGMAQLVGAVELPLTPDVIIDVWSTPACEGMPTYSWSTTSIDGVGFAVLERVFVISETVWGISQVVQVDLFGRQPAKGILLLESIFSTDKD